MRARDWIEFSIGSPRNPRNATFVVYGPWGQRDSLRSALGYHTRDGWQLRWGVGTGVSWRYYTVTVSTFKDILCIVRLGPVEAATRMDAVNEALNTLLKVDARASTWS